MLVSEIIQRVQNLYSRGTPTDESRLSDRHVYSKLLTSRSFVISQMAHKKQYISHWNYQTLDCVELIKAKSYECDCIEVGCDVLRSKYPLPKPITNMDKTLISAVSTIDGKEVFSESTWAALKYQKSNKYTGIKPYYLVKNQYLYLYNMRKLKVISITGLFEDPTEVLNFPSYCNEEEQTDCNKNIMDMEFPIESDKIEVVVQLAVNELISAFGQMVEDKVNDSNEL
jgi:hypothetical protein